MSPVPRPAPVSPVSAQTGPSLSPVSAHTGPYSVKGPLSVADKPLNRMECSDSGDSGDYGDFGEERDTSPERNRCCGAHAFLERKISEQLIAISLVELPDSGDSQSEEEGTDSEKREQVVNNPEARKRLRTQKKENECPRTQKKETNPEGKKRVATNSEDRKVPENSRDFHRKSNSSSGQKEERWRQLVREEEEYERYLEEQVAEFEEQSKTWRVKPNRVHNPSYKFHMRPIKVGSWLGLLEVTQLDQCVETLIKSHLHTIFTAMQYAYQVNPEQVPTFVIWMDYDLEKLKLHQGTVKMTMQRMELGSDGEPVMKDRKLNYLRNGEHSYALSYCMQSLRFQGDEFLREYGLKMETGTFAFANRVIKYLLMKYDHSTQQHIMNSLMEPVLILDEDESEGCHRGVIPQN